MSFFIYLFIIWYNSLRERRSRPVLYVKNGYSNVYVQWLPQKSFKKYFSTEVTVLKKRGTGSGKKDRSQTSGMGTPFLGRTLVLLLLFVNFPFSSDLETTVTHMVWTERMEVWKQYTLFLTREKYGDINHKGHRSSSYIEIDYLYQPFFDLYFTNYLFI